MNKQEQTAEEYLKDKQLSASLFKVYKKEDVLKALKLKEQELTNNKHILNIIKIAKQEGKQELWDCIMSEDNNVSISDENYHKIKKEHNLK